VTGFEVLHPLRFSTNQPFCIVFHSNSGKELGRLVEQEDGSITFSGSADASAQVFFDSVVACNSKRIRELAGKLCLE
jgi:hypothetical protein